MNGSGCTAAAANHAAGAEPLSRTGSQDWMRAARTGARRASVRLTRVLNNRNDRAVGTRDPFDLHPGRMTNGGAQRRRKSGFGVAERRRQALRRRRAAVAAEPHWSRTLPRVGADSPEPRRSHAGAVGKGLKADAAVVPDVPTASLARSSGDSIGVIVVKSAASTSLDPSAS